MYQGQFLTRLAPREENWWALPDSTWARAQVGTLLCPECRVLQRSTVYPRPIDAVIMRYQDGLSYSAVAGGGVKLIHDKLFERLEPHLRDCAVGLCTRNGRALTDYRTFYMRQELTLLGDAEAENYSCSTCRVCTRTVEMSDSNYVVRSELPHQYDICETQASIFLSESLAHQFPWSDFPDLEPVRLAVRDSIPPGARIRRVREAIRRLTDMFQGNWMEAFDAVEREARKYRIPDGMQTVYLDIGGIPLEVTGHSSAGIIRMTSVALQCSRP